MELISLVGSLAVLVLLGRAYGKRLQDFRPPAQPPTTETLSWLFGIALVVVWIIISIAETVHHINYLANII